MWLCPEEAEKAYACITDMAVILGLLTARGVEECLGTGVVFQALVLVPPLSSGEDCRAFVEVTQC